MHPSLGSFVRALDDAGELHRIRCEVNPSLEISAVADRVSRTRAPSACSAAEAFDPAMAACGGPALLFERVQGCDFPVLINAFGSYARMEMALGRSLPQIAQQIGALTKLEPPKSLGDALRKLRELSPLLRVGPRRVRKGACQQVVKLTANGDVDLTRLPLIKCWPLDGDPQAVGYGMSAQQAGTAGGGGRYITLAGMHTIHADDRNASRPASHNIGMYRAQLLGPTSLAMHWHMHHDGAAHWRSWKTLGQPMPIAICLGGESVLPYGATAPLPPGISELLMCGFLNGRGIPMVRAQTVPLWVPANSEIVIEGWVSTECGSVGWEPQSADPLGPGAVFEGPFGDHTGFYSLPDRYPRVEVTALTHRRDAIYPTTIVGPPPQEDYYLGKATERIFLPLLQTLAHDIKDYHLPQFGCFHNAAFISVRKAYPLQARRVMASVWGAGQMAWTKLVFVFDDDALIHDEAAAMRTIFERCHFLRDTMVVQGPLDILDHAAPWLGAGSKMGFDCTTKIAGEALHGVALDPPRVPLAADVAAARTVLTHACKDAGLKVRCEFPDVGRGRLCVVVLEGAGHANTAHADEGSRALDAVTAALGKQHPNGAADFVIIANDMKAPASLNGWCWWFFLMTANCDPGRDMTRAGARIAFDATRKSAGMTRHDLPTRRFPPLLEVDAPTNALLDRRWKEYGL